MSGERGKEMQAEPALQGRGWGGFCWEGAAEGCFAAGDGVSAAADPHQPAGTWARHSKVAGDARCSGSGPLALPALSWSYPCPPDHVSTRSWLWSQGQLCLPPGMGCGSLGVPSLLAPWVGFPHRRSRRAGMEHSDRHPRCKISLGVTIGLLSGILCWKAPPSLPHHCCASSRARWELLMHQGGVRGAEAGWQSYPNTAQRCLPGYLLRLCCCLNPLGLWAGCSETEVGPERFVRAPGAWAHTFLRGEGPKHTSSRIWLWLMQLRSITQNISHMT